MPGKRSTSRKPAIHVTPRDDGWARIKEGAQRASSVHGTKAEAESAARVQAKREQAELIVHDRHGEIQRRDSYGNDPHPPKG